MIDKNKRKYDLRKMSESFISDIDEYLVDNKMTPVNNFEFVEELLSEISLHYENIKDDYEFHVEHSGEKSYGK